MTRDCRRWVQSEKGQLVRPTPARVTQDGRAGLQWHGRGVSDLQQCQCAAAYGHD